MQDDAVPAASAARGDSTRLALVVAAIEIFGRDGFAAAGTRSIAQAAGVNQALIGYHFGGKPGLYLAAVEHIADSVWQRMGPLVGAIRTELEVPASTLPASRALELLGQLTDGLVEVLTSPESAAWARVILREQQEPTEGFDVLYERVMSQVLDVTTRLVARARGAAATSADAKLTALSVLGQALVFRAARAAVMRHMGWNDMNRKQIRRVQSQIRRNTRAIVDQESELMISNKNRLLVVVPLLLVAAGVGWWLRVGGDQAGGELELYGNVDIREVELAFRVPGRLLDMAFDEGDRVEAGQTLARLDPQPHREALAVADARVAEARANLAKLEAGSRPEEVRRAEAQVNQAEALVANAEADLKRQSGLLETGASSQKIRDAARARRDELAAQLAAAREALALAKEGFRAEDIAAARAGVAAAVAQRAQAQTQLDDCELVAPSAGTLIARIREPGSMVAQGAPVYSLSLRDPLYVRAYVGEPDLGRLAPGARVTVHTDSSEKIYEGQVGFISPRAEFTPKTVQTTDLRTDLVYRVRIVVDDADEGLRQGMPVTVRIPDSARD